MRPSRATLVLMVVLLFGIDPTVRAWWTPLRAGLVRMAEVMVLPYRVARLSTQRPTTDEAILPQDTAAILAYEGRRKKNSQIGGSGQHCPRFC